MIPVRRTGGKGALRTSLRPGRNIHMIWIIDLISVVCYFVRKEAAMVERPETNMSEKSLYQSPRKLLLIMVFSIFAVEMLIMTVINYFHFFPISEKAEIFLDSSLLVFLLSPTLYFFLFRPLIMHINERRRAEEYLQGERDMLETVTQNIGGGLCVISRDYKTAWSNRILKQI